MKFTLDSATLAPVLTAVAKAIPAKPTEPILSGFLLEIKKETLRVTASDTEMAIRGLVKVEEAENGTTVIPAGLLVALSKALPAGNVSFETGDNCITARWKGGESTLPSMDPKDYINPSVPEKDAEKVETVSDTLVEAIRKTVFAVKDDPTHPAISGLCFDINEAGMSLVGTDQKKMAKYDIPLTASVGRFILPLKATGVLKSILPKETPVTIVYDQKNVRFCFGQMEVTSRLIMAKYPDYKRVFPDRTTNPNACTVMTNELLDSINRLSVVADKQSLIIKANLTYNKMALSAADFSMKTNGQETLETEYDGDEIEIGLVSTSLAEILSQVGQPNVTLSFKDSLRAMLVEPQTEDGKKDPYTAIVMPHRIR